MVVRYTDMRLSVSRVAVALLRRHSHESPSRTSRRFTARSRARLTLALLPPVFVLVFLAVWAGAEAAVPEITDPDYHARLQLVRAAVAEHPNRPLGVVLGSSRTVWSFHPEQLTEPNGVYWVNGSHVGAGPTLNRVLLHRFLRDGVKPAVVVIEVMPSFFVKENQRFVNGHFAVSEVSLARRYSDKPFDSDYHFLRHRLIRATDLARVADPLAGYQVHHSRGGHKVAEIEVSPAERTRRTASEHRNYGKYLRHMTVRPTADLAFRDTLKQATDHSIRVVLLRSPEGPTFRSWYDPEGLKRFDGYIASVASEFGALVIDARLWLDEEDFFDSHHVLKRGADKFTARFAREVVPLVR